MKQTHFLIAGGTGFIGSWLRPMLLQEGHYVTVVTRSPDQYKEENATNQTFVGWGGSLRSAIETVDVVINLAGKNLFTGRWTEDVKESILQSRVESTKTLVDAMAGATSKPGLFISASAAGYYGDTGDNIVDESAPAGDDFLATVCNAWEEEALKASKSGIRVAIPRLGLALQEDGGIMEKMTLPFQLFAGGPIGHGNQYLPWIHMHDLRRALIYPVFATQLDGPYNVCSPNPVTMNEMARAMGKVLHRPSIFRVPEFIARLILGEGADPVMTSLRVAPEKLRLNDFEFDYPWLDEALGDVL